MTKTCNNLELMIYYWTRLSVVIPISFVCTLVTECIPLILKWPNTRYKWTIQRNWQHWYTRRRKTTTGNIGTQDEEKQQQTRNIICVRHRYT